MKWMAPIAFVALFMPAAASAQYRDLDAALAGLERGFGGGDVDAIISGIGSGDQVLLQFPGLADRSGFFGRDQAAYLLDGLFNKTRPAGFALLSTKANRAKGEVQVIARWEIAGGPRELYITLKQRSGKWAIASVRSA